MNTNVIGLDFDGVIADTFTLKRAYALEHFGVTLTPELQKESELVKKGMMSKEQYRSMMHHLCATEAGLSMEEVPHALNTIRKLLDDEYVLSVVTSRSEEETAIARTWIEAKGITIPFYSVGYNTSKNEVLMSIKANAYLDDDLPKLIPLQVPHRFLLTQPHNTNHTVEEGIVRVDSWDAFYTTITTHSH